MATSSSSQVIPMSEAHSTYHVDPPADAPGQLAWLVTVTTEEAFRLGYFAGAAELPYGYAWADSHPELSALFEELMGKLAALAELPR